MIDDDILRLAAEGLRLFPIIPRDKKPLVPDWPHLATTSEEQLKTWAEEFPSCNWAMATGRESGVFVLDFDGEAGRAAFVSLVEQNGHEWARTRSVKTPRGGHLYFRYPEGGVEIRNSAGKVAPGVDVRGEGGYVLIPPSIHPSGQPYTWIESPSTPL